MRRTTIPTRSLPTTAPAAKSMPFPRRDSIAPHVRAAAPPQPRLQASLLRLADLPWRGLVPHGGAARPGAAAHRIGDAGFADVALPVAADLSGDADRRTRGGPARPAQTDDRGGRDARRRVLAAAVCADAVTAAVCLHRRH